MDNIFVKSFLDLLHLLATISWFGMLFANFAVIRPSIQKTLSPQVAAPFLQLILKKSRMIIYVSLAVLFITGIPLKIVNEYYVSIINFSNNWQIVMFIKHVLVVILAMLAIFNFEYLIPKFQKTVAGGATEKLAKMKKLQMITGMFSILLAFTIILISAIMNHI